MRSSDGLPHIHGDSMKDPNWHQKDSLSTSLSLHRGSKVPAEMSMYEKDQWESTTHANPTRIHKRKHQINWLAHEAMQKEAELLDRNVSGKITKAQTAAKYGW